MRRGSLLASPSVSMLVGAIVLLVSTTLLAADNFKLLYSFPYNSANGSFPGGSLTFDAAGNLYGTTSAGGNLKSCPPQGCGTVFDLSRNSGDWTEIVLHRFDWNVDGEAPQYGLVIDQNGNLFGNTLDGPPGNDGEHYGTGFELSPSSDGTWTESILYWFHGGQPESGVILDAQGNLFGNQGMTFEASPGSGGHWSEHTIDADTFSFSSLTLRNGQLYGAGGSGKYKYGMVYELVPAKDGTWQQVDLYDFNDTFSRMPLSDGFFPSAGVVFDAQGNIYGATTSGGLRNKTCGQYGSQVGCGIVYELSPDGRGTWIETVLYRFVDSQSGYGPFSTLTIDKAGNLYGTAEGGNGWGVIFKLAPTRDGKWTYSVLHTFTDSTDDGAEPFAPMIFDNTEKHLYGTTAYGGTYNSGTVFEITP